MAVVSEPFAPDVEEMRSKARLDIESGAVTHGYLADRAAVVNLLNDALATEIVCMLRYRRHYFVSQRLATSATSQQFLEHSIQEMEHADRIAARIVQLNGEPDLDPNELSSRAHCEYIAGRTLVEMIQEDLISERVAIDTYRAMIPWIGDRDPTTRRMIEEILEVEEEHADEMADMLAIHSKGDAPPSDPLESLDPHNTQDIPSSNGALEEGSRNQPGGRV